MMNRCELQIARAYAFGLYVPTDAFPALKKGEDPLPALLGPWRGGAGAAELPALSIRLVMARDADGKHIAKGFDRSLRPRLKKRKAEAPDEAKRAFWGDIERSRERSPHLPHYLRAYPPPSQPPYPTASLPLVSRTSHLACTHARTHEGSLKSLRAFARLFSAGGKSWRAKDTITFSREQGGGTVAVYFGDERVAVVTDRLLCHALFSAYMAQDGHFRDCARREASARAMVLSL